MASLLFHRERGNAWTEITHVQNPRRAEGLSAAGISKRKIAASLGGARRPPGSASGGRGARGSSGRCRRGLTDEAVGGRLYPPPTVAATDRRPQPNWAVVTASCAGIHQINQINQKSEPVGDLLPY
jgi:hypothetical protein